MIFPFPFFSDFFRCTSKRPISVNSGPFLFSIRYSLHHVNSLQGYSQLSHITIIPGGYRILLAVRLKRSVQALPKARPNVKYDCFQVSNFKLAYLGQYQAVLAQLWTFFSSSQPLAGLFRTNLRNKYTRPDRVRISKADNIPSGLHQQNPPRLHKPLTSPSRV